MSIAPIDYSAFQRNPVGIEAVLARGGSALSSILRDAMQVGRDRANRQAAQEKDFLSERARIENLNQRRGEVALNTMQEDRRFDEGVRQFDTRMDEDARRFEITSARADTELGLREQANQRDETRLKGQLEADKFSREVLRPKELELREKEIESSRERSAAIAEDRKYRKEQNDLEMVDRNTATAMIDAFTRAVREGRNEDAQDLAMTLRDPRYRVDRNALETMSEEVGLTPAKDSEKPKSGKVAYEDMDLETIDEEIAILESVISSSMGDPSPTQREKLERLKRVRQKKLDNGGSAGSVDATSVADRLRRAGAAARGQ